MTDLTVNDIFLYSNILEKNKEGFNTLRFKDAVFKIIKIMGDNKVEINKTFKIYNTQN